MPVLALLKLVKLVPLKDWLYVGIIVAILAAFGVVYHKGELRIEAADKRAVAAEAAKTAAIESNALGEVNVSAQKYQAAIAAPTFPAPRIVCHADGNRPVSGNAAAPGASDDRADVPESTGPSFDPAEHVLAVGRQADAQVTLLQSYIKACQQAGICKR